MSQPSPLLAARQRAQALADSGDVGQALAVLEHAVELGRANLGEDDPDVLLTCQQLAGVHQRSGDPSGARRVLEEAYAAGQWRLGDTDPVMLLISYDLGVVAEEMENRHEARRAFGRVAAHGPAALGADHWAVVRARSYLGEDPPTVRMEVPAEQLQRFQIPPQRDPVQDQPAPVRTTAQQPVAEPQPRYFPASTEPEPASYQPGPTSPQPAPPVFDPPPAFDQVPQQLTPPTYHQAAQQSVPPAYEQPVPPAFDQISQLSAPPAYHQAAQQSAPPAYQAAPTPHVLDHPSIGYPRTTPPPPHTEPTKSGDAAYTRKAPAIFAAIAAVFGVIIAVVALVVVLANRGDDPASDVPTLAGPAPSDVRMRDYRSSVKLFWADPANGKASFVITGGRPGGQLSAMGQVGPTTTTFDLNGLNADLDYCFAIVAIYTTSQFSTSPQICTSRSSGKTPKPTKS